MYFILDEADNENKTDKEFILTVEDEPVVESGEESVSFITDPPCSDDYIFIRVRLSIFRASTSSSHIKNSMYNLFKFLNILRAITY